MAAGDGFSRRERQRIATAVDAAEEATGLQFCVYVGPTEEDPRAHAERLLAESGAVAQPAVLLLVAPAARRLEIITAPAARDRVSDEAAESAVTAMTERFARDDLVGGVVTGVRLLAAAAGPARSGEVPGDGLPDVLGE
ncbi:MAG: DUF5130 family protein [Mycobacteriales bacterium]